MVLEHLHGNLVGLCVRTRVNAAHPSDLVASLAQLDPKGRQWSPCGLAHGASSLIIAGARATSLLGGRRCLSVAAGGGSVTAIGIVSGERRGVANLCWSGDQRSVSGCEPCGGHSCPVHAQFHGLACKLVTHLPQLRRYLFIGTCVRETEHCRALPSKYGMSRSWGIAERPAII